MIGRTTTRIVGATIIVGASFWATLLVTPALPQSETDIEPFVPWLMKFFEPAASVETRSESAALPVPRPRPVPQPPKIAAVTQGTPANAHMHTRPREESIQPMPKFLLGPTMVPPDEQIIQPTRIAAQEPTRIPTRAAV